MKTIHIIYGKKKKKNDEQTNLSNLEQIEAYKSEYIEDLKNRLDINLKKELKGYFN